MKIIIKNPPMDEQHCFETSVCILKFIFNIELMNAFLNNIRFNDHG